MTIPYIMFICLIVTIIVELLVAFILQIRDKRDFINIILVNVLTNPLLISTSFLIFFRFGKKVVSIYEIVMEIIILLVEGAIYNKYLKYKKINSYAVSFILNACSYFIGSIIIDKII